MRNRAIVIVLLVAVALCILASVASAGGVRTTSSLGQRTQTAGLIWGGNKGPAPPPPTIAIGQQFSNLLDQITRPSWRRVPGLGWWGDHLQLD